MSYLDKLKKRVNESKSISTSDGFKEKLSFLIHGNLKTDLLIVSDIVLPRFQNVRVPITIEENAELYQFVMDKYQRDLELEIYSEEERVRKVLEKL
jgi:hypothetical protein